jgi:hypothetical protein
MLLTLGLAAAGTRSAASASDDTLTIDGMSPGELVLRVGLVGSYWQADSPANVSVYADGRVVVADADEQLGYAAFVIDLAVIEELLRLAAEAAPFDDVDYGEVMVTDVGSTRVEVHSDQGDAVVTVWALEHDGGLTSEQRQSRQRLLALVNAIEGLALDTSVQTDLAAPPHDWTSPWLQGVRMTTQPFEEWMAVDTMARTVLP